MGLGLYFNLLMEFQSNPYLVWQIIPGLITLGIGIYIETRPTKKRESRAFALLMFGGALWAFANAIQLITPSPVWQKMWTRVTYLGIMTVPTAWFLLSVKFTGFARARINKIEKWLWVIPGLLYLALLTTDFHQLFFSAFKIVTVGGYTALVNEYGFLFYVHTGYSYLMIIAGMLILGVSLTRDFKRYGVHAYGLIIGVLAPLLGNAYFLFGSTPAGFPDPTPIIFTVTGIAFAWAIFSGNILEVVPLAHDALVRKLSTGIVILDREKNIRDINPAARSLLGLTVQPMVGKSLPGLIKDVEEVQRALIPALQAAIVRDQELQLTIPATDRTLEGLISRINDNRGNFTGWLIQFNDISERKQAEANLITTRNTYEHILDSLQETYFETDRTGALTFVNQAYWQALGYADKEAVLGKNFRHFVAKQSVREMIERFQVLFQTKQPIEPFDYYYRRKDGSVQMAEIMVSPILEKDEAIGARGTVRDISARIKAEETLRDAKEYAEHRAGELAAINRLAETVSRSLDLNDILQSVCRELTSIFEIRNAGIGLLTSDKQGLEIVAFHAADPNEKSAQGMILPVEGNASTQEVIRTKKVLVIQDAQSDPRMSSMVDISKSRGTKSIMIVPLLVRGEAIGTIGMPAKNPDYIFTENEMELAETIASQLATAIDNAQLYAKTESALNVAERDLEIGRQIQSGFFPERLPEIPGWEVATYFHAARQVAGDFYDAFELRNSKFTAFVIADVCDKGVGAALFMVLFRSLLRAFSEVEIHDDNVQIQLQNIILNTNNFIARYHGRSNMFATMFFGVLDPERGILYYVNGGHEPPVIMNKDGCITQRLMPTGPAVGMFPEMDFAVEQIQLDQGDMLVGFTDGTTDAQNDAGELFSEERLVKTIANPWTSIFSMLFELKTELRKHMGERQQFDDITLISFRRKLDSNTTHHAVCRPAQMDILDELQDFVESAAAHSGLNHETTFAFKLAMEEACANIIQHGYQGREPGLLTLFFDVKENLARLTIRDDGNYFSPEQAKVPDLEADWDEREIGGLGVYLVKELMDKVTYERKADNVNQLTLEKILKRGAHHHGNAR